MATKKQTEEAADLGAVEAPEPAVNTEPAPSLSKRPNDTKIDAPAGHHTNSTFASRAKGDKGRNDGQPHPANTTFADRAKARGKNKRVSAEQAESK